MASWNCVPWFLSSLLIGLLVGAVQSQNPTTPAVLVGSPCQFDSSCPIPNSYCRASRTCSCKSGYTPNSASDSCDKVLEITHIGDPCENDKGCVFSDKPARCSEGVCRRCNDPSIKEYANCQDKAGCAYHEYGNSCWRYRKLGENCENNEECWIFKNSQNTRECKSSICQCRDGYELMSGILPEGVRDQCLSTDPKGGSNAASVSLVCLFVALMTGIL